MVSLCSGIFHETQEQWPLNASVIHIGALFQKETHLTLRTAFSINSDNGCLVEG